MSRQLPLVINKLINFLIKNLKKIEAAAFVLVFTGLLIQNFKPKVGDLIILSPLVSLALIYYITAFQHLENQNQWDNFYLRLSCFSLSAFAVCATFILNRYPGGLILYTASITSLSIATLVSVLEIKVFKKGHSVTSESIMRLIIALAITGLLAFTPQYKNTRQTEQYRNSEWQQFEKYDKETDKHPVK